MPLQATSGAASYDAFGGGVVAEPNYIESCFSTYLYTGTGANQTITNGIDLSTKGGLIWIKDRVASGLGVDDHYLQDTARGVRNPLFSNLTNAQLSNGDLVTSVSTTGFVDAFGWSSNNKLVSWTFRKQPKFFDVVTYTGNGTNRTIAHSLGSVPGCIIVKRTDFAGAWQVYHCNLANTEYIVLNTTAAKATGATRWNSTTPTSTDFSLGTDTSVNANGGTYVAYLFAHNAGGFGLTGTDNVISCGSFTTDGSGNATVSLGYEPQWMLLKQSSGTAASWTIVDSMRGFVSGPATTTSDDATLNPNNSNEEGINNVGRPTATGFEYGGSVASQTFIYIAIRRGPMKVPTSGTSVFKPAIAESDGQTALIGFPPDAVIFKSWGGGSNIATTRLEGNRSYLVTNSTAAASTSAQWVAYDLQNSFYEYLQADTNQIFWAFRRAPNFFDEVCYTGDGVSSTVISHNLGVQPEFIAIKRRNGTGDWTCVSKLASGNYVRGAGSSDTPNAGTPIFGFNNTGASSQTLDLTGYITSTGFRPSVLSQYSATNTNVSGSTYVAYLFATCAGVSKVGNYTGNGSTQTIDCGFGAGGARFVLIKRTDSTGNWYVYDTARGMTTLTDPYLLLNSTAAESATLGSVTTITTGFAVNASILAAINTNAASYIFLAIA